MTTTKRFNKYEVMPMLEARGVNCYENNCVYFILNFDL